MNSANQNIGFYPNYMSTWCIPATYRDETVESEILLEIRQGPNKGVVLSTRVAGMSYRIEANRLRTALRRLLSELSLDASISLLHTVTIDYQSQHKNAVIVEKLRREYTTMASQDFIDDDDLRVQLICIINGETIATDHHGDIVTALDELIELLGGEGEDGALIYVCPFCHYWDTYGLKTFCLRDVPSETLHLLRSQGKRANPHLWWTTGGVWDISEFHTCDKFVRRSKHSND